MRGCTVEVGPWYCRAARATDEADVEPNKMIGALPCSPLFMCSAKTFSRCHLRNQCAAQGRWNSAPPLLRTPSSFTYPVPRG